MRRKTHFTVQYGPHVAKFSSNRDAMFFAEAVSRDPQFRGWLIEVGHKSGLVGQYRNGHSTLEFAYHHACAGNGPGLDVPPSRLHSENAALRDLVKCIIENDPHDIISDGGHTVLDLWRHNARAALAKMNDC